MKTIARCGSLLSTLVILTAPAFGQSVDEGKIKTWLAAYDQAFNAKDLQRLATFYHPDVTVFEGGSTNNGWADYRDHHLGPELKEFENLQFSHSNVRVHPLGSEVRAAYVTAEYSLKAKVKDRDVETGGLATLILVKGTDGNWQIRHSHTSSRRRPAQPPSAAADTAGQLTVRRPVRPRAHGRASGCVPSGHAIRRSVGCVGRSSPWARPSVTSSGSLGA